MSRQDRRGDQIALLQMASQARAAKRQGRQEEYLGLLAKLERAHAEHRQLREAEHARRHGRKPLDAAAIAAAGVAIADAQGLDEVSMRKIAAVLGSGTMSLYHYVRTKEDLLAAMQDLILGEVLVQPAALRGNWRSAFTAIAKATRETYRRHPWALGIQSEGGRPGLNGLRHVEQSLEALASTGLGFDDKLAILVVIDDYIFGHSVRATEVSTFGDGAEETLAGIAAYIRENVTAKDFPVLTAEIGDQTLEDFVRRWEGAFRPDDWFEMGLEAVMTGLAQRYHIND